MYSKAGEYLHTSKRMHFIEDETMPGVSPKARACIRQNVCTSLRMVIEVCRVTGLISCIRQNVCTSLRSQPRPHAAHSDHRTCIRQNVCTSLRRRKPARLTRTCYPCIRQNVCTSLRNVRRELDDLAVQLAYVKTYALH